MGEKTIKLKKITFLGRSNFHIFEHKQTGKIKNIECSDKEYKDLAKKDFPQPKRRGYRWVRSEGGGIKADTPDGRLKKNEYVILEDGTAFVATNDTALGRVVDPTKISNDEITDKDLWQ